MEQSEYTVEEAAVVLGLTKRQVNNLVQLGILKARRIGKMVHVIDGDSLRAEQARRLEHGKGRRLPNTGNAGDPPTGELAAEPTPEYHAPTSINDKRARTDQGE